MQGAQVQSLVRELDPTHCNEDGRSHVPQLRPIGSSQTNKYLKKKRKKERRWARHMQLVRHVPGFRTGPQCPTPQAKRVSSGQTLLVQPFARPPGEDSLCPRDELPIGRCHALSLLPLRPHFLPAEPGFPSSPRPHAYGGTRFRPPHLPNPPP